MHYLLNFFPDNALLVYRNLTVFYMWILYIPYKFIELAYEYFCGVVKEFYI